MSLDTVHHSGERNGQVEPVAGYSAAFRKVSSIIKPIQLHTKGGRTWVLKNTNCVRAAHFPITSGQVPRDAGAVKYVKNLSLLQSASRSCRSIILLRLRFKGRGQDCRDAGIISTSLSIQRSARDLIINWKEFRFKENISNLATFYASWAAHYKLQWSNPQLLRSSAADWSEHDRGHDEWSIYFSIHF